MEVLHNIVPEKCGYMPVPENANPRILPCAEISGSKVAPYEYDRSGVVSCQKTSSSIKVSPSEVCILVTSLLYDCANENYSLLCCLPAYLAFIKQLRE